MVICSVVGVDLYQRGYTAGGAALVMSELDPGSSGAVGEAGALVSLHWQGRGEYGKPVSSKCLSFQTLI